MLKCTTNPSLARLCFPTAFVLGVSIFCPSALHAQEHVDVIAYFQRASDTRGAGLAHKTKPVDARPAKPGEIVVTMIRGQGKETQSPPANPGHMVVRNRCPETGNEEFLVTAGSFSRRYEGPIGSGAGDGWLPYRPFGIQMRFVVVAEQDGEFSFRRAVGRKNGGAARGARSFKTLAIPKIPIELQKRPSRAPTRLFASHSASF